MLKQSRRSTSLAPSELVTWLEALEALPQSQQELLQWIEGPLRRFFPFERLLCTHGELLAGQIQLTHSLSSGHEDRYLHQIATTFELSRRSSLAHWLRTRQPFTINLSNPHFSASKFEIDEILEFGLRNVAAHGILNIRATAGTYFSFCGVDGMAGPWHEDALRVLTPVLSELFMSLVVLQDVAVSDSQAPTSPRQAAIIRLVASGHDNKTIAAMLSISEKTVRNQLSTIFARFGVHRRTQLVDKLK